MSTAQRSRFSAAIQQLELLRSAIVDELRRRDESRLAIKLQLDDAIRCLRFCEANAIAPSAKVTRLPPTLTSTPSSEYRIVEDHESDDRAHWTELQMSGLHVRPLPGTLLLEQPGSPEPAV